MASQLSTRVKRVLYHHRTQGKAVEGVHIRGITDALRADGVAVDIISLPGADPYATPKAMSPTQQATSLMKLVAKLPEPLFELAEMAYNLVSLWRVRKHIKAVGKVDFIYERYSLYMIAIVWLANRLRIPIILEVNDSAMVERVRPLFFLRIARAFERWAFQHADGLVFVSSLFRDRIQQAHGKISPAIVTPNAANIDKFSFTSEQRDTTRQKLGLQDKVVCGYLGAFVPWHAIDKFVYEIAPVLESRPDLAFVLVGDGATFPEVMQFVKERKLENQIHLTGRVSHDQVPGFLSAMDLAILPSAGDYTSPVKLFEFMACGIAPIAPNFAPIQEVITEGETAWTFPAGDMQQAVNMVLKKSQDRTELARVGRAARAYIKAKRQWRNNVVQLVDFVESLPKRR